MPRTSRQTRLLRVRRAKQALMTASRNVANALLSRAKGEESVDEVAMLSKAQNVLDDISRALEVLNGVEEEMTSLPTQESLLEEKN